MSDTTSPFRFLCMTGFFAIFSSTISKSPVLPLFAVHLGADPSGVGVVAAVSALTGVLFSIPAGLMADRIGRRKMLILSSLIFSVVPFLYLFVSQIWQLALVRFLHGLGTAIFLPVGMAFVSDIFLEQRGEKMGWFSTATLLGRFCAPIAGGAILSGVTLLGDMRFGAVYIFCGAMGVVTLWTTLRMPVIEEHHTESRTWRGIRQTFTSVLSSRTIIITSTVEAAILFAYGTFETFVPLAAQKAGIGTAAIGIMLSAQVLTLALTKPVMGRFSDRHGRRPQIFYGAILGALCISSFSLVPSFEAMLVASILLGLCLSIVTSATSALIADSSRRQERGSAMGMLGSVMDIGHTTGPLVAGFVASYFGVGYAFIAPGGLLAAIALCFLFSTGKQALVFAQEKNKY
ncbi:MAG TPA: MFS transporter [Dissulfurispiraceae bacterium]|nr:MFS transporter [Dissulfurispiraceae bacterium]